MCFVLFGHLLGVCAVQPLGLKVVPFLGYYVEHLLGFYAHPCHNQMRALPSSMTTIMMMMTTMMIITTTPLSSAATAPPPAPPPTDRDNHAAPQQEGFQNARLKGFSCSLSLRGGGESGGGQRREANGKVMLNAKR
jgi:hypothetical protein